MLATTQFSPDPYRAAQLDAGMHLQLADSLDYIREQAASHPALGCNDLDDLIRALRDGARFDPYTFCLYYDLAGALFDDQLSMAQKIVAELVNRKPVNCVQRFSGLSPENNPVHRRYFDLLLDGADGKMGIACPSATQTEAFQTRFNSGLALARQYVPALHEEFQHLVREVVCIAPDPACASQVDGGSHYRLWGALFLNSAFHQTDVAVVEVIAHESAHSLLFGYCTDEALVNNPDDERYASPLRRDLRPMDGIYHATFVSARMCWAMNQLADAVDIDDERRTIARQAAATDIENFWGGLAVVRQHGDLTETGQQLMNLAETYMRSCSRPFVAVDAALA